MRGPDSPDRQDALPVAIVLGAHGLHGRLRIRLHDPTSEALRPGTPVTVVSSPPSSESRRYTVKRCDHRPGEAQGRLALIEIEDRTAAELLRGATVLVEREDLPALAADEFYVADLIGLRVRRESGEDLGVVRSFIRNGPQDLVEVRCERGGRSITWLLPILPGFVREVTDTEVLVDLPEGMGPDDSDGGHDPDGPHDPSEDEGSS